VVLVGAHAVDRLAEEGRKVGREPVGAAVGARPGVERADRLDEDGAQDRAHAVVGETLDGLLELGARRLHGLEEALGRALGPHARLAPREVEERVEAEFDGDLVERRDDALDGRQRGALGRGRQGERLAQLLGAGEACRAGRVVGAQARDLAQVAVVERSSPEGEPASAGAGGPPAGGRDLLEAGRERRDGACRRARGLEQACESGRDGCGRVRGAPRHELVHGERCAGVGRAGDECGEDEGARDHDGGGGRGRRLRHTVAEKLLSTASECRRVLEVTRARERGWRRAER